MTNTSSFSVSFFLHYSNTHSIEFFYSILSLSRTMALNIGNRQVNLDDLDTIIFDNSEIAVDPTTLDSVFSSILPLRDSFYSV